MLQRNGTTQQKILQGKMVKSSTAFAHLEKVNLNLLVPCLY